MKNTTAAVRLGGPTLSLARSALADHIHALASAKKALQASQEPLQRLQHWADEVAAAEAALKAIDADYEARLTSWAATGHGEPPEMNERQRQAALVRVAQAKAKHGAAQAAAGAFQDQQQQANGRLRELDAEVPRHVADVLLEEASALAAKHNSLLTQAAGIRAQLQGLNDLLCSASFNSDNRHHGYRHPRCADSQELGADREIPGAVYVVYGQDER